jgi:PhnB protein
VTTAVPEEFGGVTPQLVVPDTAAAVQFYVKALAADELLRTTLPDGKIMHCELLINGGRVLVHDEFPETGSVSPKTLRGTAVRLHLYVDDVDVWFARAVGAGAVPLMAPYDAFWGDRYAQIEDIAGHHWSLASRLEDPTASELQERGQAWFDQQGEALR